MTSSVAQVRYWGSTLVSAEPQVVLNCLAKRWAVEVFFENAKDLLGSDHYQLQRSQAIERFWALIALVGSFLDEQRALLSEKDKISHSWGEGRSHIQAEHRLNLLKWLQQQFQEGQSVEALNLYLAA